MSEPFEKNLDHLKSGLRVHLKDIARGIEKEGLRCTRDGQIARTTHPKALGHPLTHPQITTDYAESLLELITPVFHSIEEVLEHLTLIHRFVHSHLDEELMWSGSMPCRLDGEESILIANYGQSNLAKLKMVYREGLGVRYGRIMQSIAGIHYNFSLPDSFWQPWAELNQSSLPLKDFKSDQYFALIRNFRRFSGLIMYLFGASPSFDESFLAPAQQQHTGLEHVNRRSWMMPGATSLRMGDMGYHNNAQSGLNICFNKLENFISSLNKAIHTPYPPYEAIGTKRNGQWIQLNTNVLQIENEYYSTIRPKRTTRPHEKPIHALSERGVEYIEIRCLDLDPYEPVGTSASTLKFLDVFLLYCLLERSPWIDDDECERIERTFEYVTQQGRNTPLALTCPFTGAPLRKQLGLMSQKLLEVARLFEDPGYEEAVRTHLQKIGDPSATPSARIETALREDGLDYLDLVQMLSARHHDTLTQQPLTETQKQLFKQLSEKSFSDEHALRESDRQDFDEYLNAYLS